MFNWLKMTLWRKLKNYALLTWLGLSLLVTGCQTTSPPLSAPIKVTDCPTPAPVSALQATPPKPSGAYLKEVNDWQSTSQMKLKGSPISSAPTKGQ